jgi:hypothetical protein
MLTQDLPLLVDKNKESMKGLIVGKKFRFVQEETDSHL